MTTINLLKASSFRNATAISQIYTSCSKINGSRSQGMSMCSMQAMIRMAVCACFCLLALTRPTTFLVPQSSRATIPCISNLETAVLVLDSSQTTFQANQNSRMAQLSEISSSMETRAHTLYQMDKSNLLVGMEFILLSLSLLACSLSSSGMLLCLVSKTLSVAINQWLES